MQTLGHSVKCQDLTTYWNIHKNVCAPCDTHPATTMPKPGQGFTPNCGLSDDGGRHESYVKNCNRGTFNNGSFLSCQKCSSCTLVLANCTSTADTQCQMPSGGHRHEGLKWLLPIILVSVVLFYIMKQRNIKSWYHRGAGKKSHSKSQCNSTTVTETQHGTQATLANSVDDIIGAGKESHSKSQCNSTTVTEAEHGTQAPANSVDDIIAPELQVTPIQHLLNNLDILEELLVLLDPDKSGLKNTRHLAARCNFPSTWINYAYYRRDIKSPFVAMLEAIASQSPEWTVGQLALLLHDLERHDAISVLKKTPLMVKKDGESL